MTPKDLALVAHDGKKDELLAWAKKHLSTLKKHRLYATGTTGSLLKSELGLEVHSFKSGPLGGDMQIGAFIAEDKINALIFFWDPLESQPHDPDVKALLRISVVWNIPFATNPASADYMITSPYFDKEYEEKTPDFTEHLQRFDHDRQRDE